MPKFRVYRYYVGCRVYEIEANSADAAAHSNSGVFLHEANDPNENPFFTEIFASIDDDEPLLIIDEAASNFWRNSAYPYPDPEEASG
ncbi:hypothetical protein [Hyphomicrobium sp.]|uniref:hypothetical protein n=1 Tax=Hyphomicrobium sp. TaxID=82 RepID=UPI001DF78A82|nr:hypothetical protein [Hyphomicrobium sp.]MBY0561496.1 hypothetical protein [Hyphomicrobium sp.]